MQTFHFEAITKDGERLQGKVQANDALSAVQALQADKGYVVTAMKTDAEVSRMEEERLRMRHERQELERKKREAEEALARSNAESALAEQRLDQEKRKARGWFVHEAAPEKKSGLLGRLFARTPKPEAFGPPRPPKPSWYSKLFPKKPAKSASGAPAAAAPVPTPAAPTPATPGTDVPPAPPEGRSLLERALAKFFPGYAAKRAAAHAAQSAARSAKDAADSATDAAHVARRMADTATSLPLTKKGEEQKYSKTLGATLIPRRSTGKFAKELRESRRLRHEERKARKLAAAEKRTKKEAGGKSITGKIDLTKSITGNAESAASAASAAAGAASGATDGTDPGSLTGSAKIALDLKRIEIPQTGLREFLRQLRVRYLTWKKTRLEREEKKKADAAAKLKADAAAERQRLLDRKKTAAIKAAQAKKKAEDEAAKKGTKTKTVAMPGKEAAKLTWWQKLFPSLFKPKTTGEGSARRMNFSTSEEEQQHERDRMMLLIQGFKPTGNPFVDAYNKINDFFITHSKIKLKELVTFYNLIAVMINAGIPLVKSLHQLVDQQKNPRFKRILFQIVYEIENGKSLSRSMKTFPDVFTDAHVGMVESGEASGQLGTVMKRIAEETEKSHKMLSKVKGALMYPMVIMVILAIVMVVVMVAVVPKMVEVFSGAGVDLPLPTRILIAVSDFLIARWYVVLAVSGALAFGFTTYIKTEEGKYYWDYAKLKLPIFGVLFMKVSLARFTRSLSTLSSSGLSIIKALRINADSVGNEIFRQEILATSESVKKGVSIAKDLKGNKLFPAMVVDMIEVGEETAQVANVAQKISDFYEAEVEDMVKNMQSLMEPIIIVVVGIMVGGLVAAIMLPIMQLSKVATQG